jgi:ribose transport system permease protein
MTSVPVSVRRHAGQKAAKFTGVYVALLLIIIYTLMRPHTFPTVQNLRIILGDEAVAAILAIGLILPLASELFDISVGAAMGMAVILVGFLQEKGMNPIWAALLTAVLGLVIGGLNSIVIVGLKVSPIIATLGMSSILSAVAYWITAGAGVYQGLSPSFFKVGQTQVFGIPIPVFYLLAIALIIYYVLEHTNFGRSARAVGGNPEAARLAGIQVNRIRAICLISGSLIACLAGVVYTARIGTSPLNAGDPYLLSSFSAVFLGSTQVQRGRVNVVGTLIAVYLIAIGVNGLQLIYPSNAWLTQFFQGAVLIVAVALAVERHWSRRRSLPPAIADVESAGALKGVAGPRLPVEPPARVD